MSILANTLTWHRKLLLFAFVVVSAYTGAVAADSKVIRLATTTSTDNSGLLAVLLPVFENRSGFEVQVIAVGTGKALRMGQMGDADVLLVHARDAELAYVAEGYGVDRRDVMYNQFIIVGPNADPVEVEDSKLIAEALRKIYQNQHLFVSRGDDSGTHKKELQLWKSISIKPDGNWYRETGQGMGKTLFIANELDAYTLTDKGTWLALKGKLGQLSVSFAKGPELHNAYGIIATNPERYSDVNYTGAKALIDWIATIEAKNLINGFMINGEQLFHSTP